MKPSHTHLKSEESKKISNNAITEPSPFSLKQAKFEQE